MNNFKLKRPFRDVILSLRYPPKIIDKIYMHLHIPLRYKIKFYIYYRKYVIKEIYHELKYATNYISSNKENTTKNKGPIWVFWWQGFDNMPIIIKRCIESIKYHSHGHKFIFIDKWNVHKYANIPNYIYYKLNNGNMSLTEFSDILRFNLLCIYGGLWIDSSMYCTSDISDKYFSNFYTAGGYTFKQSLKLLASKWTEFLIGGSAHNKLFVFMNKFFMLYWKHHKYLIDYLLADSALDYAYKINIDGFKTYVNNIAWKHNPHMYDLVDCLNKRFNRVKLAKVTKDTNLFKLTYKRKFVNKHNTFYNKLINNKL